MLRSLFSLTAVLVGVLSVTSARAQSATSSVAAPSAASGWETPAAAAEQTPSYTNGWNSAAGLGSGMITRPSTDYWGRPLHQKVLLTRRVATRGIAVFDDPAMRNAGMMLAPGLNTAPYRGVSTDYWGQPLRNPASVGALVKARAFAAVVPFVGQP